VKTIFQKNNVTEKENEIDSAQKIEDKKEGESIP
jgi:hypothetical protein